MLRSFYESVTKPDGFVRQYLELAQVSGSLALSSTEPLLLCVCVAQLGVCIGDTLFVHGAVDSKSAGFLPSDDTLDCIHEVVGRCLPAKLSFASFGFLC